MAWKFHLVWPLCAALTLTDARAATDSIIETVYYDFTFEIEEEGIRFDFPGYPWQSVSQFTGSGEYSPLFGFGFFHHGNEILDLQGETLSLGSLFSSPPAPIELAWQSFGADDSFWSLRGNVTFGADNAITDWSVNTDDGTGEDREFWSDAEYVHANWRYFDLLDDASAYIGRAIYGVNDSDHYGQIYWTSPGRWITSIERACWIGSAGYTRVSCQDNVAVAPVPPSLMLMATGLAGLGFFRRRSRRPTGPARCPVTGAAPKACAR